MALPSLRRLVRLAAALSVPGGLCAAGLTARAGQLADRLRDPARQDASDILHKGLIASADFTNYGDRPPMLWRVRALEGSLIEGNREDHQSMVFMSDGAYFEAAISVAKPPRNATLAVRHLSSSAAGCQTGGWSPITITLNGRTVVKNHSPREHGYFTEEFDVSRMLRFGENRIKFIFDNSCSKYWLNRFTLREGLPGAAGVPDPERPPLQEAGGSRQLDLGAAAGGVKLGEGAPPAGGPGRQAAPLLRGADDAPPPVAARAPGGRLMRAPRPQEPSSEPPPAAGPSIPVPFALAGVLALAGLALAAVKLPPLLARQQQAAALAKLRACLASAPRDALAAYREFQRAGGCAQDLPAAELAAAYAGAGEEAAGPAPVLPGPGLRMPGRGLRAPPAGPAPGPEAVEHHARRRRVRAGDGLRPGPGGEGHPLAPDPAGRFGDPGLHGARAAPRQEPGGGPVRAPDPGSGLRPKKRGKKGL